MDTIYWGIFGLSTFAIVLFFSVFFCLAIMDCIHRCNNCAFRTRHASQANQTTGNISGHVPGQNAPPYPDAYLSIEHIIVENELNKSQKCTEAPPSYEEAMRLALAHSNSLQTYEVEQRSANQQLGANQATSSATPIAPTHQPTALPLERF
uniref:Secreted protein n=1 Tax=Dendroctonus ponderosae TaxID=77166 RepID=A0AAR5PAR8_DENPD